MIRNGRGGGRIPTARGALRSLVALGLGVVFCLAVTEASCACGGRRR